LTVNSEPGSDRLDAQGKDLSSIPDGMLFFHEPIGSPKILCSTPRAPRCAASDKPYGPDPMIATSTESLDLVYDVICKLPPVA